MIEGYGPVTQALLGTLLTWGLTAFGSAMVIFLRGNQVNIKKICACFCPSTIIHQMKSVRVIALYGDIQNTQLR